MTEVLSRTSQSNGYAHAGIVAALEAAWDVIRSHHPQVPQVVVVVAASRRGEFGYFHAQRWQHGEDRLPEVLIGGEGLKRGPEPVFVTLLHEATHGLAYARGISDTSRGGRYHNKCFAELASEMGLDVERGPRYGWTTVGVPLRAATIQRYSEPLARLGEVMRAYRHRDETGPARNSNNPVALVCACPRKIRASLTCQQMGPIDCPLCGTEFAPEDATVGTAP